MANSMSIGPNNGQDYSLCKCILDSVILKGGNLPCKSVRLTACGNEIPSYCKCPSNSSGTHLVVCDITHCDEPNASLATAQQQYSIVHRVSEAMRALFYPSQVMQRFGGRGCVCERRCVGNSGGRVAYRGNCRCSPSVLLACECNVINTDKTSSKRARDTGSSYCSSDSSGSDSRRSRNAEAHKLKQRRRRSKHVSSSDKHRESEMYTKMRKEKPPRMIHRCNCCNSQYSPGMDKNETWRSPQLIHRERCECLYRPCRNIDRATEAVNYSRQVSEEGAHGPSVSGEKDICRSNCCKCYNNTGTIAFSVGTSTSGMLWPSAGEQTGYEDFGSPSIKHTSYTRHAVPSLDTPDIISDVYKTRHTNHQARMDLYSVATSTTGMVMPSASIQTGYEGFGSPSIQDTSSSIPRSGSKLETARYEEHQASTALNSVRTGPSGHLQSFPVMQTGSVGCGSPSMKATSRFTQRTVGTLKTSPNISDLRKTRHEEQRPSKVLNSVESSTPVPSEPSADKHTENVGFDSPPAQDINNDTQPTLGGSETPNKMPDLHETRHEEQEASRVLSSVGTNTSGIFALFTVNNTTNEEHDSCMVQTTNARKEFCEKYFVGCRKHRRTNSKEFPTESDNSLRKERNNTNKNEQGHVHVQRMQSTRIPGTPEVQAFYDVSTGKIFLGFITKDEKESCKDQKQCLRLNNLKWNKIFPNTETADEIPDDTRRNVIRIAGSSGSETCVKHKLSKEDLIDVPEKSSEKFLTRMDRDSHMICEHGSSSSTSIGQSNDIQVIYSNFPTPHNTIGEQNQQEMHESKYKSHGHERYRHGVPGINIKNIWHSKQASPNLSSTDITRRGKRNKNKRSNYPTTVRVIKNKMIDRNSGSASRIKRSLLLICEDIVSYLRNKFGTRSSKLNRYKQIQKDTLEVLEVETINNQFQEHRPEYSKKMGKFMRKTRKPKSTQDHENELSESHGMTSSKDIGQRKQSQTNHRDNYDQSDIHSTKYLNKSGRTETSKEMSPDEDKLEAPVVDLESAEKQRRHSGAEESIEIDDSFEEMNSKMHVGRGVEESHLIPESKRDTRQEVYSRGRDTLNTQRTEYYNAGSSYSITQVVESHMHGEDVHDTSSSGIKILKGPSTVAFIIKTDRKYSARDSCGKNTLSKVRGSRASRNERVSTNCRYSDDPPDIMVRRKESNFRVAYRKKHTSPHNFIFRKVKQGTANRGIQSSNNNLKSYGSKDGIAGKRGLMRHAGHTERLGHVFPNRRTPESATKHDLLHIGKKRSVTNIQESRSKGQCKVQTENSTLNRLVGAEEHSEKQSQRREYNEEDTTDGISNERNRVEENYRRLKKLLHVMDKLEKLAPTKDPR